LTSKDNNGVEKQEGSPPAGRVKNLIQKIDRKQNRVKTRKTNLAHPFASPEREREK